ncbi:MAG TPA: hypothetical protein VJ908_10325 [Wenzhouxiangellaceae bacterium]|nr:hypothetical protein [Wenzhouxiangellaceae bacterium]
MKNAQLVGTAIVLALLGAFALAAAGPTAAMPGWSHSAQTAPSVGPSIDKQQRDQIKALHGAYRAALSELDWRVGENGHAPDTMQQARELRMALRAEIFDVLHRGSRIAGAAPAGSCPYSGESTPGRPMNDANTLYL